MGGDQPNPQVPVGNLGGGSQPTSVAIPTYGMPSSGRGVTFSGESSTFMGDVRVAAGRGNPTAPLPPTISRDSTPTGGA